MDWLDETKEHQLTHHSSDGEGELDVAGPESWMDVPNSFLLVQD